MDHLHEIILALLDEHGPMLGKELHAHLPDMSNLELWQACFTSDNLQISQFSRYYLRFDITRKDYIRLSPSILRDFMSFTLVSRGSQRNKVAERLVRLSNEHREISRWKTSLARNVLSDVFTSLGEQKSSQVCAFIAGDLAYFLGHNEPREVAALGEIVKGSDLDIVIVHKGLSDEDVKKIEEHMLVAKNYLLRTPSLRQELDFIVKPLSRMYEQFAYKTIQEKIASKIVYESLFMAGSVSLYSAIMEELRHSGVQDQIAQDFDKGLADRSSAVSKLLGSDRAALDTDARSLFYFSQERIEFE